MDTIQIAIKIGVDKIGDVSQRELQEIRKSIDYMKSPYGHTYCDCLEISTAGNFIVKISYPRFFAGINAYLISSSKECMEVQEEFYKEIKSNKVLRDAEITLNRVDIPFTFLMKENYSFKSYKKIYQILNYVYKIKNPKACPKAFTDIEKFEAETLIYADTPNIGGYNKKVTIYDQHNNIKAKTGDGSYLCSIEREYKDLDRRMRIEVSKRVQRKEFSVEEFGKFNIFKEYSTKYREYILDNLFDLDEIENLYNKKAEELKKILSEYRADKSSFFYEVFIYKNIDHIHDYEIMRRALKLCIENVKTRENAITAIRRILDYYEFTDEIIIMETYKTIKEIREVMEKHFID